MIKRPNFGAIRNCLENYTEKTCSKADNLIIFRRNLFCWGGWQVVTSENLSKKVQQVFHLLKRYLDGLSTYALSLLATLLLPALPLPIEWLKTDHVEPESYLITVAVLAAGFGFSAEHNSYRAGYGLLFLTGLILDIVGKSGKVASQADGYAWVLLLAVAALHGSERFWWHVVLDRPFPDGLKGN